MRAASDATPISVDELRALAARRFGDMVKAVVDLRRGLVLLDAHADVWDQYYGERFFHGTPFRRAVEEGLLDPSRSFLASMRGSL